MAPRIPGEIDGEETEDDVLDEGVDDEAEDQGEDQGPDVEGSGDDERTEGRGEDEREAPQGDGRRRVLSDGRREAPLARANRLAQEARAEADRVARELADFRAEQQQRQSAAQETPEQEATRLALMEPEQRSEYRLNKALAAQNAHMQRMQFQFADQTDRAAFNALQSTNPLYKRVAAKVETELATIRRQNQNVSREQLAAYLIGKEVLERGPKAVQQARKSGERRIEAQRTRPSAGRSDQGADDRRRQSLRDRLADVTF